MHWYGGVNWHNYSGRKTSQTSSHQPPTDASDIFWNQFFTCCFDKPIKLSAIRSNFFIILEPFRRIFSIDVDFSLVRRNSMGSSPFSVPRVAYVHGLSTFLSKIGVDSCFKFCKTSLETSNTYSSKKVRTLRFSIVL